MDREIPWPPLDLEPLIVLLVVAVTYVGYQYSGAASFLRARLGVGQPQSVFLQRIAGAIWLGLIPGIYTLTSLPGGLGAHGFALGRFAPAAAFVGFVVVVVLPIVALSGRNQKMWPEYPMVRSTEWNRSLHFENAATWILYLAAYEFFFRGFFLFAMERAFGLWPAIAIVTVVYVLVHIVKSASETISTIPMGVLFALAAWSSGSFLAPLIAHAVIAITSDVSMTAFQRRAGYRAG